MAPFSPPRGRTVRSFATVVFARGVVRLLGLVIAVLLADRLGAGAATDAFLLVRRLTLGFAEALRRVVAVVYIPPFVSLMRAPDRATIGRVWRSHLIALLAAALVGAGAILLLAPWVLKVFAPGFDVARAALAAHLLRILVFTIPAGLVLAIMTSLLFASRRFGLPELARALPGLLAVMVLLLLVPPLGIAAVGWALLAGTVLVIIALAPSFRSVIKASTPEPDPRRPASRGGAWEVTSDATADEIPGLGLPGRTLPALLLLGAAQGATWIDLAFASAQGVGGLSALEFGYRIVNVLPILLVSSLNAVMYTEFAHMAADQDAAPTRLDLAKFWRAGLFLLLPFITFVWVAAGPLVALLFGHGAFSATAAETTTLVIRLYTPTVLFVFLRTTTMSRLFAEQGAPYLKVAGAVAAVALVTRVGGAALLIKPMGVLGIALAASLSNALVFTTLYLLVTRHWGRFVALEDLGALARMAIAAALSAGAMFALLAGLGNPAARGLALEAAALVAVGAVGAIVYLGAAAVLKVEELSLLRGALRRVRRPRSG